LTEAHTLHGNTIPTKSGYTDNIPPTTSHASGNLCAQNRTFVSPLLRNRPVGPIVALPLCAQPPLGPPIPSVDVHPLRLGYTKAARHCKPCRIINSEVTTTMSNSLEAKIVVLGSQGVGKTSLVHRYVKNAFTPPTTTSTIGASFLTKRVVDIDTSTVVRLQIWDTAGQERFRSISKLYYRGMLQIRLMRPVLFIDGKHICAKLPIKTSEAHTFLIHRRKCGRTLLRHHGPLFLRGNGPLAMRAQAKPRR
jgi:Ras of Complex, Roc, domain of DAPkinase